jgi:hypothetical protein
LTNSTPISGDLNVYDRMRLTETLQGWVIATLSCSPVTASARPDRPAGHLVCMPGTGVALPTVTAPLIGHKSLDGLVAPELNFDVSFRGPGGPRLVPAVPSRIRDTEPLHEPGQLAEEEHGRGKAWAAARARMGFPAPWP